MSTSIMIYYDSGGSRSHKDELNSREVKEMGYLGLGD